MEERGLYTCNVTFVTSQDREAELLSYLRGELLGKVSSQELETEKMEKMSPGYDPQLKKVVEAGGERLSPNDGQSIAFSLNFPSEETAHLWYDHTLMPALSDFSEKFGDQALYFVTLLENLPL